MIQFPINYVYFILSGLKVIFTDRKNKSYSTIQWLYCPHIFSPTPAIFSYLLSNFFAKPNLYEVILIVFSIFYNKLFFSLKLMDSGSTSLYCIYVLYYYFLSAYCRIDIIFPSSVHVFLLPDNYIRSSPVFNSYYILSIEYLLYLYFLP